MKGMEDAQRVLVMLVAGFLLLLGFLGLVRFSWQENKGEVHAEREGQKSDQYCA